MPLNPEPTGIVEGTSRYPPHTRPSFSGPHDGGSASRTEFHAEPAVAFVGTMLVSHQRFTGHLDLFHFEEDRLRESATGSPLAELAVAHRRQHRSANGSITHVTAQTAAFVDFTHSLRSGVKISRRVDQIRLWYARNRILTAIVKLCRRFTCLERPFCARKRIAQETVRIELPLSITDCRPHGGNPSFFPSSFVRASVRHRHARLLQDAQQNAPKLRGAEEKVVIL